MIDKSIIEKTTSWPFVEARKLIKDRESNLKKKGKKGRYTRQAPVEVKLMVRKRRGLPLWMCA